MAEPTERDQPDWPVMDLSRFRIPDGEPNPVQAIIARRRRQMLVHSYLYYLLDQPIIDDARFDEWARDLVELQTAFPDEAARTVFHEHFADFNGATGFDLPLDQPWIEEAARHLLDGRTAPPSD